MKCVKCGAEVQGNHMYCRKCASQMNNISNTPKKVIITIIIIAAIILVFKGCAWMVQTNSDYNTSKEEDAFQQQMSQDPSTWNQEQKDRYNDFSNWEAQQNNK